MSWNYSESAVNFEIKDGVAWIELHRPDVLNALSTELILEYGKCVARVSGDPNVKVLVTHSSDMRSFSVGSDLTELSKLDLEKAYEFEVLHGYLGKALYELPIPTIAVIEGFAIGGGLTLALSHDIRICSRVATFSMPEVNLGWNAAWGIKQLVDAVGKPNAKYLLFTADTLNAREAVEMGLVQEQIDRPMERVKYLAHKIASLPAKAMKDSKQIVDHYQENLAAHLFAQSFDTDEARERVNTFLSTRR